jgi:glycosyltransferase involved in cell wall biosynthesis
MFVTVAICTFNRADSLRLTLDSLIAMEVPSDLPWELLIVNNNSMDHTDDVIGEYVGRLPVRREFESKGGKSNALNRAIDVAKGDYIVWIDDDVLVDPGLLTAYAAAFRRWPEAAVFGGRVKPKYEAPVEKWVLESEAVLGGPYAIRDFGDQVRPFSADDEDHFPYGANWAIRAIEQRAFRRARPCAEKDSKPRRYRPHASASQIWSDGLLDIGGDGRALHRTGQADGTLHRRILRKLGRDLGFSQCRRDRRGALFIWHTAQDLAATAWRVGALPCLPLRVLGTCMG